MRLEDHLFLEVSSCRSFLESRRNSSSPRQCKGYECEKKAKVKGHRMRLRQFGRDAFEQHLE